MTTIGIDDPTAAKLLDSAVANVLRDYPTHWLHVINSPADLKPARTLHPIFAGSFDWHSCVHQTWTIVRLVRHYPHLPAEPATTALNTLITQENAQVEADFFATPEGAHWERPYGWAWLLLLDAELATWQDTRATTWRSALSPLTKALRTHCLDWLTTARLPMRVGTHRNSAFALALCHDAATALNDEELANACHTAAQRWYAQDQRYGAYEPDAADFLSPVLTEADLLRRLLPPAEFATWFDNLLPDLHTPRWTVLTEPVEVDDPEDPYGSHLAGLALSRAWCWQGIANALPADHQSRTLATQSATAHAEFGWRYVFGHGYYAEHWLGTFATYLHLGALTN